MVAFKSVPILLASIILVIAEAPPEYQTSGSYQNRPPVNVRQTSGVSKIFGWLGSRFAKIPYFLPRVPSFPKFVPQQELPEYQTVILPDPSSSDYKEEANGPEDSNLIQEDNLSYNQGSFNDITQDKIPDFKDYEVVPSHLSYEKDMPPVPASADDAWQGGFSGISASPITSPALHKNPVGSNQIPVVPQSMGPDYFNTAYTSQENKDNQQFQSFFQSQVDHQPQSTDKTVAQSHYQAPQKFNNYQAQQQIDIYQGPQFNNHHTPQQINNHHAPQKFNNFQAPQQFQGQSQQNYQSDQSFALANNNFGLSFGDSQQQQPQLLDSLIKLGAVAPTSGSSAQQPGQVTNQRNPYSSASFDLNQADFGTLLSSLDSGGHNVVGSDTYNVQGSHIVPVATKPPQKAPVSQPSQNSNGYISSGIPGVQILSQSEDGGNPVFEVLADADAPSFGGHPFDINKLIAMIEPGAQLVDAPQLSESASETKKTYAVAPTTSGISDLLLSESHPEPSFISSTIDDSKHKKQFSSFFSNLKNESDTKQKSSLKEIMDFFQQTGGKGYVLVEKKTSPNNLNLTDVLTTPDDDLTNGFARINITSESPLHNDGDKDIDNSLRYSYISHGGWTAEYPMSSKPKLATPSFGSILNKLNSFKTLGARKPFQNKLKRYFSTSETSIKFSNLTSPTVFFAVKTTTRHPNHNYNSFPYPGVKGDLFPTTDPIVNTMLDIVHPKPIFARYTDSIHITTPTPTLDDEEELSFAESNQVKSIAITVTPPPHLTSSSTTSTSIPSELDSIAVTKKSVSSSVSSSKRRPAPVYRGKSIKISNHTVS